MDAVATATDLPVGKLGSSGVGQTGIPLDRDGDTSPVGEGHDEVVVSETDGGGPGCRKVSGRRTHLSNVEGRIDRWSLRIAHPSYLEVTYCDFKFAKLLKKAAELFHTQSGILHDPTHRERVYRIVTRDGEDS